MATRNYLGLVTDVIIETGLNSGAAPSSVTSADGDAAKVCYWVRVADAQIQRERIDWNFLWGKAIVKLTQGSVVVPAPTEEGSDTAIRINAVAKKRLAIVNPNGEPFYPVYMKWDEFATIYDNSPDVESDYPSYWTINPAGTIKLSGPMESADYTCNYEYWRKPTPLAADNDISLIPDDYERLIVLLAKILYAEHEDAPEVDVGSTSHYNTMLDQMIATEAPEAEWQRMENSDQFLQVETRP